MISNPIKLIEATADDIPFLRDMLWEALQASPAFVAHMGIETIQRYEDNYWSHWSGQTDPAYIAQDGNERKLGAVLLKPNDWDKTLSGWRLSIGIEADARGQGIGQRLINHALQAARTRNKPYVNLVVDPTNQRAIALYRRLGFVEVGIRNDVIEMRFDLLS